MQLAKEFFHLPLAWEDVLRVEIHIWTDPETREHSMSDC